MRKGFENRSPPGWWALVDLCRAASKWYARGGLFARKQGGSAAVDHGNLDYCHVWKRGSRARSHLHQRETDRDASDRCCGPFCSRRGWLGRKHGPCSPLFSSTSHCAERGQRCDGRWHMVLAAGRWRSKRASNAERRIWSALRGMWDREGRRWTAGRRCISPH